MKRIRCPKCNNFIIFDDTKTLPGQVIDFLCSCCGNKFSIRRGVGTIVVIENAFHYKQVLPLRMGDNFIGRYMKGNPKCNTPIQTDDPSIDMNHCVINVSRDKNGNLKYVLSDGPSYTGTFVDNQILGDNEKRVIENDTLFTIGATSIILKTPKDSTSSPTNK